MKYEIRYNHRSTQTADSKEAAIRMVRHEAYTSNRLAHAPCEDGLYIYKSAKDKARDPDGSRAFAVICPSE